MMAAETTCAGSDPCEGSVDPEVLNMQPIAVEGYVLGPMVQDLNNIKLTNQVRMKL